jgi:uncharacterized protein (TIGR00730 family)
MKKELIISVFGSSRPKETDADYLEARTLGRKLGEAGFAVCTGAYSGIMEAISRGAKAAGAKTYGVSTEAFRDAKVNAWVDVEIRTKSWQERLFEIIKLGDGFVACKGGTGTLAELAVAWEMMNKSVMPVKPLIAMGAFWGPALQCIRSVEIAGANPWAEANGALVRMASTADEVAQIFKQQLHQDL